MARYDFRSPSLYLDAALARGDAIPLDRAQANYLQNVLRLPSGAAVLVFNGRDGEWRAQLKEAGKRGAALEIGEQTRAQTAPSDLHWVFAPLKHARLDYMVQKAVEMGVSRLQPITTRHSQVTRVNGERMRANAIEAAEQCGILTLPEIAEPTTLDRFMAARTPDRTLIFCDEDAPVKDPVAALAATRKSSGMPRPPVALLVGPEGGFAEEERLALLRLPNVVRLALGPRILRADTAAVAALALVQAVLGDWRADATGG
ncbi:MAG: 16S rRNA (uracil(1498)-N(3))-methyltransferase [Xanthobacteraceae bacterium]